MNNTDTETGMITEKAIIEAIRERDCGLSARGIACCLGLDAPSEVLRVIEDLALDCKELSHTSVMGARFFDLA